jgi:adenylate cyclase
LIVAGMEHCAPRNVKEQQMADQLHFSPDIRLACQTLVTGDVKLRRLVLDADDVDLTDQLKSQSAQHLVGEERRVAVLFADIRGFTAFAEELPPYDIIHALNRYFYRMEQIIRSHRGYVDNYMGDGLLAIFGIAAPDVASHDAVLAGLEMLDAVEKLGPYYASVYGHSLRIGIGVHYGNVVLGSIGPPDRDRVTAIGDTVNFASRIEAANKVIGTSILISDDTYHCVKEHVEVNRFEEISLPGRTHPCTLYEVVGMNK